MSKKQLAVVADYEVGYGKPPKEKQFTKGLSGNPNGRPRGSKNKAASDRKLEKIILKEANREIEVSGREGLEKISVAQAIVRAVAVNAAKGDHRSQKLMVDLVLNIETRTAAEKQAFINAVVEYKVEADLELARRKKQGVTGLDIVPHPDDIFINHETGEVQVFGPTTYREKESLDKLCDFRKELQDEVDDLNGRLEDSVCVEDLMFKETRIKTNEKCINEIDKSLQGWKCR